MIDCDGEHPARIQRHRVFLNGNFFALPRALLSMLLSWLDGVNYLKGSRINEQGHCLIDQLTTGRLRSSCRLGTLNGEPRFRRERDEPAKYRSMNERMQTPIRARHCRRVGSNRTIVLLMQPLVVSCN